MSLTIRRFSVGSLSGFLITLLTLSISTADEVSLADNTQEGTPPTPQEALALIEVPEGFHVTLFAGEPDVQQPISLTTDERGRVWIAENYTYAESQVNFDLEMSDRVVILEDTDGDGRSDQRKVFWDEGKKLTSVEVGHGGVWVLCAPQLLFIPDRNRDDIPDGPPEVVLDGFAEGSVRHNIVNGLKWGPDGWLYGRHGIQETSEVGKPGAAASQRTKLNCCVWRYHPVEEKFEVVCQGTTNSWGFDYDEHGQMFFINTVIGHLWHIVPGAHYRRMYGADFNPHTYQLIEQCADHFHWDTGERWSEAKKSLSDTTSLAGGGHAHSGLMIYQGNNWPQKYHNTMLTLNFHGQRMNNDRLVRQGSGYVATHSDDLFFANSEWFRGLDLITGPDGGVLVADWSDSGECHESDGVHRTSGRIYKVVYESPEAVAGLDLAALDNLQLVELQLHKNDWYGRQARRLLHERTAAGQDMSAASEALQKMFREQTTATRQLRALWSLHLIGSTDEAWLRQQLSHESEHIRVWAVRLLAELDDLEPETTQQFFTMAFRDPSGLVRLYLASALQSLPLPMRWSVAVGLVSHAGDANDRSLPLMIWYGIEPAVPANTKAAVEVAKLTEIPLIRQHIARRLATDLETYAPAINELLESAAKFGDANYQLDVLQGMELAVRGLRKAPMPAAWAASATTFAESPSAEVQQLTRQLGVVFGDGRAVDELFEIAQDSDADPESRRSALRSLLDERSPETLALLKEMLTDKVLANEVVRGFAVFDAPEIADHILGRYPALEPAGKVFAIDTLTARPSSAKKLLEAVASGRVDRTAISAFHARQIHSFGDESLTKQLEQQWGAFRESSAEKKQRIEQLRELLQDSGIATGDPSQGRHLFEKTCSSCHVLYGKGTHIGPDLTGANRHNLTYLLENIVDPSASVGKEFRVSAVILEDGRVVTGVVGDETERTLTVQTQQEKLALSRDDIDEVVQQEVSLMPDGVLKQFSEEQIIDLFAYLSTRSQVPVATP